MTRAMKDSGIEWIGQIPEHWDIKRNKYNFELGKDIVGTKSSKMQLLSLTKYGIKAINEDEQSGKVPTSFNTYQQVHINDLVMCLFDLDVSAVFSGLSAYEGMISPAYKCFKCKNHIYPKYVDYYFKTVFVDRKYKKYSKNVRFSINADEFMALPIVVPPQAEQQKIADYLDKKCGEIDAIAAKIQEQITTLEEYKKSVISEAVTKGLNPNTPMKDSGIEWIGKIPANWEVKKLKYLCDTRNEKYTLNKGELDYFALENIISWNSKYIKTDNEYNLDGANLCYKGDVVFGKLRPYLAKVFLVEFDRCCSTEFAIFCNFNGCNRFYKYVFLTQGFVTTVDNSTYGIKMPRANIEFIKNVYIPSPSKEIQQEIADYLDSKCSQIEKTIADKQEQIKTLEEYKKTLIYEYVTGKKEVA